ncbi:MAG: hypothetical protein GY805_01275 [Chloroflexi bacterium]|nr:hypothetical protein [Chloroflexota bacterium]
MKKYISTLILFAVLAAACNTPAEEDGAEDGILPTLVPTIVVAEAGSQNTTVEEVEQSEPEAEANSEAAANEEEAAQPEEEMAAEEDGGEALINLDDYFIYDEPQEIDYLTTLEFYMTVLNSEGEEEEVGYVYAEGGRTVTPDASTMTFGMEGNAAAGLGETMIVTRIEDAFYYVMPPNDCISLAGQGGIENPFALFLDTGGFLTEDAERVLPDETINGVPSYHYALNQDNLMSWDVYEIYDADLYIAKEGGYVVRLLITGFGLNEVVSGNQLQEGDIYYELNFIPGEVPEIGIPAGCQAADEITTEYPVLDDATAVQTAPGLFTYETQTPFDEVIEFYKTELTKDNEWAVAQELILEPNASVTFTGVGGTLMVNLGPGLTEGGVLVNILVTP